MKFLSSLLLFLATVSQLQTTFSSISADVQNKPYHKPKPLSLKAQSRQPLKKYGGSPTVNSSSGYSYKTLYFDQKIDHFGFATDGTFRQRYLYADQFWDKGKGPIFFYTGNEGDIAWFCNNTGFMWDIAPQFKALLVFAEHRYYGESMPFGQDSYKNSSTLNYLTSEQALADFAVLIRHLTTYDTNSQGKPTGAPVPVVSFGGSYGGMLSAWMRMKYPNLVVGSLAASAPVWQLTSLVPCSAFYATVSHTWSSSSPPSQHSYCATNLHNLYADIEEMAQHMGGYEFLTKNFRLCDPMQSKYDLDPLFSTLVEMFTDLAEVDYPYPADFLAPLPAWPVQVACSYLSQPMRGKELLRAAANVTNMYFNYTGSTKCVDYKGSGSTKSLGYLGWAYQSCTEMVMPMCSNFSGIIYNIDWDFQEYSDSCYRQFGVRPRPHWATTQYWGKQLKAASNIIFSNGLYDPWSSGGVLHSVSPSVVAITIGRGGHHLDLRSSHPGDTPEVIAARKQEVEIIKTWLGMK